MTSQPATFGKLDTQERARILGTLFRHEFLSGSTLRFERYLDYYEKELGKLTVARYTTTPWSLIVNSHAELAGLINEIRTGDLSTRTAVCDILRQQYTSNDDKAIDRSLEMALRIWLMLNVREPSTRLHAGQVLPLVWQPDQHFSSFIAQTFPKSRWSPSVKESRVSPAFTAAFMVNVCGLKLEWTTCLADHLRLNRRKKKLHVFAFKSFLAGHLDTSCHATAGAEPCPLPSQLLTETIWTLNILFPQWNADTNQLLEKHGQDFHRFGPYDGPPMLNLTEFEYWRDRISELYDVVFLSPPVSWAQLWKDRRNPQQFWTFWIALVILLLTLVSTVATIIQTWASVSSLKSGSH